MKREQFRNYLPQLSRFKNYLYEKRYTTICDANEISFAVDSTPESVVPVFDNVDYTPISLPFSYGGIDTYHLFKVTFKLDKVNVNKKGYALLNFGLGNDGLTIGTETIMYYKGLPYSGVDKNHREIPIDISEEEMTFYFRVWSGIPNKERLYEYHWYANGVEGKYFDLTMPRIATKNELCYDYYYLLNSVLDIYETLKGKNPTIASKLITDAYTSFLKVGILERTTEKLISESFNALRTKIKKYQTNYPYEWKIIGQSHIDVVWLWREKHTREKIARTFSTVIRQLEENEDYKYFQSQPVLLAHLQRDYPGIFAKLQKYAKEGRFIVDGAMWLEADTNIPNGESLARQVIYGKRYMKKYFDVDSKTLWMPDVFGYSPQLPQILARGGVDNFYTTKMTWNQTNRMPHHTFNWQALDGTCVLTHLQENIDFWTINSKSLVEGWDKYPDSDVFNSMIYGYGYGDGGGGPAQESYEAYKWINEIGLLPEMKYSSVSDYYNSLRDDLAEYDGPEIQTWTGELYLELHRGTFTSQAKLKYMNRLIEHKLRVLEMHFVKTIQDNKANNQVAVDLEKTWEDFLLNQFHDIIPGTCIKEAVDDAELLYDKISNRLDELLDKVFVNYRKSSDLYVLNPTNSVFSGCINIGKIKCQNSFKFGTNNYAFFDDLEPFTYLKKEAVALRDGITKLGKRYDFGGQTVVFDDDYNIISWFDKMNNREEVQGVFNELRVYEDIPLNWSAWDIDIFYRDKGFEKTTFVNAEVSFENDDVFAFKVNRSYHNSKISQLFLIYKNKPVIDCKYEIEWHEKELLLRVEFENKVNCRNLICDSQYGNLSRPVASNTSWEKAKFEFVAHKWVGVTDHGGGYALINNGKYGFNYENNTLGMSLIKCGVRPDANQDNGVHEFSYCLYGFAGSVLDSDVEDFSTLYQNTNCVIDYQVDDNPLIKISNDNIVVAAFKKAFDSDDIILRVHDYHGKSCEFESDSVVTQVVDLLEKTVEFDLTIGNYEVKTFVVEKS